MLQTLQLTLTAGQRNLLVELDCLFESGQCWVILGRNGSGKSTLLQTLAGLRGMDRGQILLDGQSLSDWPVTTLAQRRAWLPQGRHDAFGYTALDCVLASSRLSGHPHYWDNPADMSNAHAALSRLDATDLANRDLRTLSGGERQRIALAAVVAQPAELLLLDEPDDALDLPHGALLQHLLTTLCHEEGKTVIFSCHDLNLAYRTSTHALLLCSDGRWHAGKTTDIFTPEKLSDCFQHPIRALMDADAPGDRLWWIADHG